MKVGRHTKLYTRGRPFLKAISVDPDSFNQFEGEKVLHHQLLACRIIPGRLTLSNPGNQSDTCCRNHFTERKSYTITTSLQIRTNREVIWFPPKHSPPLHWAWQSVYIQVASSTVDRKLLHLFGSHRTPSWDIGIHNPHRSKPHV